MLKKNIQQRNAKYYVDIFEEYKNNVKRNKENVSLLIIKSNKRQI